MHRRNSTRTAGSKRLSRVMPSDDDISPRDEGDDQVAKQLRLSDPVAMELSDTTPPLERQPPPGNAPTTLLRKRSLDEIGDSDDLADASGPPKQAKSLTTDSAPASARAPIWERNRPSYLRTASSQYIAEFHDSKLASRVSVAPTGAGTTYSAAEVVVTEIRVANDRPPTQFGKEGQKSHTVAWELMRTGFGALSGYRASDLLAFIQARMDATTPSELNSELSQAGDAGAVLRNKLTDRLSALEDHKRPANEWRDQLAELLTLYIHYYQLSNEATYKDGRPIGHGEPTQLDNLSKAEGDGTLDIDVVHAAMVLRDVNRRLSLEILKNVLHHWLTWLKVRFPKTSGNGEKFAKAFREALKYDDVALPTPDVRVFQPVLVPAPATTWALADRPTFVAEVALRTNAIGPITLAQATINWINASDDRPPTRYGLLQKSHTVAWSLLREQLRRAFSDKPATTLVTHLKAQLQTLEADFREVQRNGRADDTRDLIRRVENLENQQAPAHEWGDRLSELVESYVTLYQLSPSATYGKEERPNPHGESQALDQLQKLEIAVTQEEQEWSDGDAEAAAKLLDVEAGSPALRPTQWARAITHWEEVLKMLYPNLATDAFLAAAKSKIAMTPARKWGEKRSDAVLMLEKIDAGFEADVKQKGIELPKTLTRKLYSALGLDSNKELFNRTQQGQLSKDAGLHQTSSQTGRPEARRARSKQTLTQLRDNLERLKGMFIGRLAKHAASLAERTQVVDTVVNDLRTSDLSLDQVDANERWYKVFERIVKIERNEEPELDNVTQRDDNDYVVITHALLAEVIKLV